MDILIKFLRTTEINEFLQNSKVKKLLEFQDLKDSGLNVSGHYNACYINYNTVVMDHPCDCCISKSIYSEVFEFVLKKQYENNTSYFTDKEIKTIVKELYSKEDKNKYSSFAYIHSIISK